MVNEISKKVFIDGSFFISFIDRTDLNHNKCVLVFEHLAAHHYKLFTSNHVVFQVYSKLERIINKEIALDFLNAISESNIFILYSSKPEMNGVYRYLRSASNEQAGLTEVINAVLMSKNGIFQVLTYDFWSNLLATQKSSLIS